MRTTLRRIGLPLALLLGLLVAHRAADAAKSETRSDTIKAKWQQPAYRANQFKARYGGNSPQALRARAEGQWADPVQAAKMIIARHGAAAPSLGKVYEAVKAQYGGNSTEARRLRAQMQHARRTPAGATAAERPEVPATFVPPTPAAVEAPSSATSAPRTPINPTRSRIAGWALRSRALAPIASRMILSRQVATVLDEASELTLAHKYDEAFDHLPSGSNLTHREQLEVERLRNVIHRARDARVGAPIE